MFTGIVEGTGEVIGVRKTGSGMEFTIKLPFSVKEGDSVSVDGVCLTVKKFSQGIAYFDAVLETIKRSTLANLKRGGIVNLERALTANGRFDGHIVLGHVDGVGIIRKFTKHSKDTVLEVEYPNELAPFIAEKGSIAIDGISLTITSVYKNLFTIALIPYTIQNTGLKFKKTGDRVNIEVDIISRYIKRILEVGDVQV